MKETFELHRKELEESLRYASCIQKALLPAKDSVNKLLKGNFIFFQPRDIVSGDFYWITKKADLIYFAVGDCTGHGIPGAFLSVLGISFLNHIVDNNQYTSASSILNVLREHIMKALNQTGESRERKDGIDISVCIYDEKKREINFSGAFHSLYLIKPDRTLVEFAGDKMQIGIAADEEQPFTNHNVELSKDDMIYIFTDGYVDQFGGPKGKKFKYSNFRKLLLGIHHLSVSEQEEKLRQSFLTWKGNLSQLDDVLIFGLKIN